MFSTANSPQLSAHYSTIGSSFKKWRKLPEEEAIDRISCLPDAVLCHMLSSLPTKQAVATSILSTRWKCLWSLVPSLDFNDEGADQVGDMSFEQFVYRVLVLRNTCCIRKFQFRCSKYHCRFLVNLWICAAITHGVEVLHVCMSGVQPVELPPSLFTCNTLQVLKLSDIAIVLDVPSSVYFPSLKILHLDRVIYQNDDSVWKLFSGCPVLQDLFITRSAHDNMRIFNISVPALKNLTIEVDTVYDFELHELEINAPALEYLELKDDWSLDFTIVNLSSLVKANLDVSVSAWPLAKLLKGLSNVNNLFLSANSMKPLRYVFNVHLPIFHNLIQLKVDIRCCDCNVLLRLLENSHKLKVLALEKSTIQHGHKSRWRRPQHVPKCLLLHLTNIHFRGFEGLKDELKLVNYFLKHAKVLRTMTICCSNLNLEKKFSLLQAVSKYARASKTCEVEFY